MITAREPCITLMCAFILASPVLSAPPISVEGAPADTGFNVGTIATIRATLKGLSGDPSRYALFASIQYVGTTAETSTQMDLKSKGAGGELYYEVEWPIPADAPTGLYSVVLQVEDRDEHQVVAKEKVKGFVAYKKLVRITRVTLDKTFYAPGESIQCEVALENLTDRDLQNLLVEFSNANYPWISVFSGEADLSGKKQENPQLGLKVLREHLNLSAGGAATIPMMPAGTVAFLQGTQVAVLGAGGPARHFKLPPPEVDTYTIAVWNAERTTLYDMQFSPQVIVRDPNRVLPKPYSSHAYTHPYNDEIDFKNYRHFYAPGESPETASKTDAAMNQLPASLMVFCPHEDDEHPYAGLIRAAVEAGIPVRVVFFTGGDVGECERYFDKPCGPNEAREFGEVRMEESMEALEHIGLTRDHVIFLGLPDGGSGAIWSEHIKVSNPFLDIYLATDHAPYESMFKPNLPFARDAVIDAVKQIITEFHPAMIGTSHPDERHVDHRTANWFVVKACQELLHEKRIDPQTVILADEAYGAGGTKPAPFKYEKFVVHLSGEAAALKQEMSWTYQSQDGNLAEGAHQPLAELPREEIHYRIVDWQEHAGWNE